MKGFRSSFVLRAYLVLAGVALLVGCSTKEDPNEVLLMCGNHSCGSLAMVTTDTSSDGYQYLEPKLSPDGNTILFSADWQAFPSTDRPPDPPPSNRQLLYIPVQEGTQPLESLEQSGATLIRMLAFPLEIGGGISSFDPDLAQKGGPIWLDEDNVIFWLQLPRGSRIFKADISSLPVVPTIPEALYFEPADSEIAGQFYQHVDPAISADGRWLAFAKHSCWDPQDPVTCTMRSIWVLDMSTAGLGVENTAFMLVGEAAELAGPAWSPDGRRLAFHSTLDLVGEFNNGITEIFSVVFDTTGLADTGQVPTNVSLRRLTYTQPGEGNPLTGIKNTKPVFSSDGSDILFISTRRAPSITLHDRSIWRIPSDGRIDPAIFFFSREDDVDPDIRQGSAREMVFSSAMGFPTEMLDRLEAEAYQGFIDGGMSETAAAAEAAEQRQELEFFAHVQSQIYIFSP